MAYTADDRLVAYGYFLRGYSFDKIVQSLRKQYPGLKAETVRRWATKYRWEKQRERHMQQALESIGASAMDERLKVAKKLEGLIEGLKGAIDVTEIKSHESAIHAICKLEELRLKMIGSHPSQDPKGEGANPFVIADLVLTILGKHPAFSGLMKKHKAELLSQVRKELPLLEAST